MFVIQNISCVTDEYAADETGCGSAWLERLIWDQEVAGSNPVTPIYNLIIMRVQFNGRTLAFQARYVGSIPITRFVCSQLSWIEQRPSKPWVEGSNPPGHTFFYESWPVAYDFCIMVGIAQLVSASDCGSEGPGFESLYPPFFYFLGYRQAVRHRVLIPALRWFESSQPSSVVIIRGWMFDIDCYS